MRFAISSAQAIQNYSRKCLITEIIKPRITEFTSTIGTAFFSFRLIIMTMGRHIRIETIGPTTNSLILSWGRVVLKMMNVTTTYWIKADQQLVLSIFLMNIGRASKAPITIPIKIVNNSSIIWLLGNIYFSKGNHPVGIISLPDGYHIRRKDSYCLFT